MADQVGSGSDDASGDWRDPRGAMAGNYRIVRPIASGAMGIVYLGEHPSFGSKAAVKVLREDLAGDPVFAERFVEEAKAAATIRHPNMVKVFDLVRLPDGRPAMVMELLEGHTLDQALAPGPFAVLEALHVLEEICAVLTATHARGVVHRDIKAENVFLVEGPSGRPQVKLLDFGIAKMAGRSMVPIAGTPYYMAPEQGRGEEVDARSDLYAVGVLAYLMLTGRFPFEGRTPREVMRKHVHELVDPEPLPSKARPLVLKLLAKHREDRFADAAELSSALHALEAEILAKVESPHESHEGWLEPPGADAPTVPRISVAEVAPSAPPVAGPLPESPTKVELSPAPPAPIEPAPGRLDMPTEPGISPNAAPPPAPRPAGRRRQADRLGAERGAAPQARLLESYLELSDRDHYAFLSIAEDVEPAAIKTATRRVEKELATLRDKVWPAQRSQVVALLGRLERARQVLEDLEARAAYDARRGNFHGVARCMAAGLSAKKVDKLRRDYIRRAPELVDRARKLAKEAQALVEAGSRQSAIEALVQALALDPLSRELHQRLAEHAPDGAGS
jgi:serine/threonine-protein kinase